MRPAFAITNAIVVETEKMNKNHFAQLFSRGLSSNACDRCMIIILVDRDRRREQGRNTILAVSAIPQLNNHTKDTHRLKSLSLVSECQCHKFCSASPSICLCLHNAWMNGVRVRCMHENVVIVGRTRIDSIRSFVWSIAVFACLFWRTVACKYEPVQSTMSLYEHACSCWMGFNRTTAVGAIYKITKDVQTACRPQNRALNTLTRVSIRYTGKHVKWHMHTTMNAARDRPMCQRACTSKHSNEVPCASWRERMHRMR